MPDVRLYARNDDNEHCVSEVDYVGNVADDVGGVLIWLVFVVALTRVARKIDSHIGKIGLNPAQTGAGIGSRIPGVMTMVAVRTMGSLVSRSMASAKGGSGGKSGRNGNSGGQTANNGYSGTNSNANNTGGVNMGGTSVGGTNNGSTSVNNGGKSSAAKPSAMTPVGGVKPAGSSHGVSLCKPMSRICAYLHRMPDKMGWR